MRTRGAVLAASLVSGVLASVCCIGPLVFALLGISGAALAQRFEPLRPYLLVVTYGLLAGAFYLTYGPAKAESGPGQACEMPRVNRAGRVALWIATLGVVLATTFPLYSVYVF